MSKYVKIMFKNAIKWKKCFKNTANRLKKSNPNVEICFKMPNNV